MSPPRLPRAPSSTPHVTLAPRAVVRRDIAELVSAVEAAQLDAQRAVQSAQREAQRATPASRLATPSPLRSFGA